MVTAHFFCRAAEKVQTATAQGWQQARELTTEGMKRFYGGPLAVGGSQPPPLVLCLLQNHCYSSIVH